MTEQSSISTRAQGLLARVPQRLSRILVVATALYYIGFIWTFTGGTFGRLFIPFQWEYFFTQRAYAETFGGRWFFYGTSISGLIVNWLVLLAVIAGAYFAYVWIAQKKK